jgi:Flp pilus assembly pilin Flp
MHYLVDSARTVVAATVARARAIGAWMVRTAPQVGQSMVEYAIIAAIVAVVAVVAVRALGVSVTGAFSRAEAQVNSAAP